MLPVQELGVVLRCAFMHDLECPVNALIQRRLGVIRYVFGEEVLERGAEVGCGDPAGVDDEDDDTGADSFERRAVFTRDHVDGGFADGVGVAYD